MRMVDDEGARSRTSIDVFVNPPLTALPAKIGGPGETRTAALGIRLRRRARHSGSVRARRIPTRVYEPKFKLSADGTKYESDAGHEPTKLTARCRSTSASGRVRARSR